ncbi:putative NBD/HSP70 family sugar kinase/DNA-binding XRE family transcriptional regulator [Oxalobacteraceae bacterium GrIS 1.18]
MLIAGDQQILKQMNRMVLVRKLFNSPDLSRADLAAAVGLTKSTVSLLVKELVEEGWFEERELINTGNLGRRPTPLHIDKTRLAILGAEFGIDKARIVATNLLGEVLHRAEIEYTDAFDPDSSFELVARELLRMAKRVVAAGRSIIGLGAGLYGGVDEELGILHYAPNLGWRNIDVAKILETHFAKSILAKTPLFIQNDANVAALAEFEFGNQASVDPLVYVCVGYGVGAGVIVHDRLLTGYCGWAGEIGHTILVPGGARCSCGRRGCAEAMVGLGPLLKKTNQKKKHPELEPLLAKVKAGDPVACQAVEEAGEFLGILLNNVWSSFDPMSIVLGGPAMQIGDKFLDPARRVLNEYALASQLPPPIITLSSYGLDVVAIGAAALVRYRLTRPYSLQKGA